MAKKSEPESKMPDFNVYVVEGEGDDAYWNKVGAAWRHKDGKGFNLQVSATALDGRYVLREPKAAEDAKAA